MSLPASFMPMRWGFVFLACPVKLSERHQNDLVRLAIQAYFDDEGERSFEWPECRGSLRVESDAVALGAFSGQRFSAEVHVPSGSGRVQFLVTEAQLQMAAGQVAEA
jgi:hypothetical protein